MRRFVKKPVLAARGKGLASAGRGVDWKIFKLKEYAQWYKLANSSELSELGYTKEDLDFSDDLPDNYQFLGTAIFNDQVSDKDVEILSDYGYDFLCAVKTPEGVKLLLPNGRNGFYEVSVDELHDLTK